MPPSTRRVALPVWGGERTVDLPVPGGRGTLLAVLPAARKMTLEMMRLSEQRELREGRKVSCKAGCGSCCRQLVPISSVEAKSLANVVERMPRPKREAIKRKFDAALAKLEEAGLLFAAGDGPRTSLVSQVDDSESDAWADVSKRYFALEIACPFLEKESCGIYEDRPLICREYLVTSDPSHCRSIDGNARAVPRPAFPSRALAHAAEVLDGIPSSSIPLVLALEWAEWMGGELGADHAGDEVLDAFLDGLVWGEELDENADP